MKVLTTKNDLLADVKVDLLSDAIADYLKNPQNSHIHRLQSSNSKIYDNSYYKLQHHIGYYNLGKRTTESPYVEYWVDRDRFLQPKSNRSLVFSPVKASARQSPSLASLRKVGLRSQWRDSPLLLDSHPQKLTSLRTGLWNYATLITGTSGNTSSAVVTNSGGVFVGSVAANDADYNRSGELIYYKDGSTLYLNGHYCRQKDSQDVLRQTVSDLKYCSRADLVFSAGYDGKIKVWNEKSIPEPIAEFSTKKAPDEKIHSLIAKHPNLDVIGCGTSHRWCYFLTYNFDSHGTFNGNLHAPIKKKTSSLEDSNRIDIIEFQPHSGGATTGHFDFFTLVGYSEVVGIEGGEVERCSFRDGSDKICRTRCYSIGDKGISCSSISSDGRLLAIGTGSVLDNVGGDGYMHLCDGSTGRFIHKIHTKQHDCDFVTWSPCNRFFASGNSINNVVKVYDIRYAKESLAICVHTGEEKEPENVMVGAWSSVTPGMLVTGGADRKVKVWDVFSSEKDSLKAEFTHSFAVNSLALNPSDESQIVVGTMSDFTIHSAFEAKIPDHISTKYCY